MSGAEPSALLHEAPRWGFLRTGVTQGWRGETGESSLCPHTPLILQETPLSEGGSSGWGGSCFYKFPNRPRQPLPGWCGRRLPRGREMRAQSDSGAAVPDSWGVLGARSTRERPQHLVWFPSSTCISRCMSDSSYPRRTRAVAHRLALHPRGSFPRDAACQAGVKHSPSPPLAHSQAPCLYTHTWPEA